LKKRISSTKLINFSSFEIIIGCMKIKINNNSRHPLPQYHTQGSAGMDLQAYLDDPIKIRPLERVLVPTGLSIELPQGYEAQIRPRSGIAIQKGITILNSPGTIDSDYRGDIGIMLVNLSNKEVEIRDGERIAQIVITKHESIEWEKSSDLEDSERGADGFGSTGQN
jgi:dUTP pyrophosphatase